MIDYNSNRIKITEINETVLVSSIRQYIATDIRNRPTYGLIYKVSGHVKYHINGRIMDFSPGMICYFPKGSSYHIERLERGEAIRLTFDTSEDPGIEAFTAYYRNHQAIGMQFHKIVEMNRTSIQKFDYRIIAALYDLLAMLEDAERMSYIAADIRERISAAVDDMGEHFPLQTLKLSALAAKHGMSASTFRRNFSRIYGMPPVKYLSILRLNSAKALLTSTDLSIGEIAAKTGYNDPFYFSKCFTESCGITPTGYRRKYQQ